MRPPAEFFDVERANKMLPLVKQIASNISDCWQKILRLRERLSEASLKVGELEICHGDKNIPISDRLKEAQRKEKEVKEELNGSIDIINGYIKEVEALGLFVAEFKRGIVHFPTIYEDEMHFLCYSFDEKDVQHWHMAEEACSARRRIEDINEFNSVKNSNENSNI